MVLTISWSNFTQFYQKICRYLQLASKNHVAKLQKIEPDGYKWTIIPPKGNTGRRNTEFNTCGIFEFSDIPTYNMQHPIQKDTYIILVAKYLGESV